MKTIQTPVIIVNFKAYEESTGKKAIRLAKICEDISRGYKITIFISPQFCDIYPIAKKVKKTLILAQHLDSVYPGSYTGHITALSIREAGAIGTLINHSEKKLTLEDVGKCIELTKKYNLISVCFASLPEEAERIATFNPDFIAIEPPELIGSGISVSKARPEIVTQTVNLVKAINPEINVLCGAGITTGDDVKKAIELGTVGIVVSSGIVKAKSPKKVLVEFANALK